MLFGSQRTSALGGSGFVEYGRRGAGKEEHRAARTASCQTVCCGSAPLRRVVWTDGRRTGVGSS